MSDFDFIIFLVPVPSNNRHLNDIWCKVKGGIQSWFKHVETDKIERVAQLRREMEEEQVNITQFSMTSSFGSHASEFICFNARHDWTPFMTTWWNTVKHGLRLWQRTKKKLQREAICSKKSSKFKFDKSCWMQLILFLNNQNFKLQPTSGSRLHKWTKMPGEKTLDCVKECEPKARPQ